MPSSDASSSLEVIGDSASRSVDHPVREGAASAAAGLPRTVAGHLVSYLRTQSEVDELCGRYGVPREFTARPAGELRMSSTPPPPGHVCVYAHALEAGMRVPLHPFFCEVLCHYRLAPTQLAPNGWRNVAGFVVLCHFAGVPPSLPVFRSFFSLLKYKGWYHFRSKDASAGVLFTGTPTSIKDWKQGYFFLSSPAPWPCPVEWGVPPKSSTTELALTSDEKRSAAKLLRARGGAAIDLQTYLCGSNLAAAMIAAASPPPTPPRARTQSPRATASSKGMEPSVYDVMKTMRAEKAAVKKAKTEPGLSPLSGKKRNREEADAKDGVSPVATTPPASHGGLGGSVSGARSPAPGVSGPQNQGGKPQQGPDRHDGDAAGWEAARKLLQDLVTPSRARVFAAANPSDVVASSYVAMLQAANYASFSLGYAMELEEKLRDAAADAGALRMELEKSKAELAEAGALRAELGKTKAELAEAGALRAELGKTKAELAEAGALRAELGKTKAELAEAGALRAELGKTKAELAEAGALRAELGKTKAELAEAGALRGELEKTKAELAEARKAAAGELEGARASMENVRRLADHALEGYERGMEHMKRVALRLYPRIDAARLVVPPGGPPPP